MKLILQVNNYFFVNVFSIFFPEDHTELIKPAVSS